MKRRLRGVYFRGMLVTLAMALVSVIAIVSVKVGDTRRNLTAVLNAASQWTLDSNADLQALADSIAAIDPPIRVTFMMNTGLILADSSPGAEQTGSHANDPEIAAALNGQVGESLRMSETFGTFMLYLARRVTPLLVLRVSYPILELAGTLAAYGAGLTVLFAVLYLLERRAIARLARDQVRQMDEVGALLAGEIDRAQALFPELQPSLNAIAYQVERLREDHAEMLRTLNLRSDFVAHASHELRSPLTNIMGFAEMLDEGLADRPEEQALCTKMIRGECERMLAVIEDILLLSKAQKQAPAAAADVDAAPLAREIGQALSPQARRKGIAIAVEGALSVRAPEKDVWEILYNLMANAVRYGKEGGHVRVRLGEGKIVVEDDGIGIPAGHLERVFEPFYRVDEARDPAGGTGLGLSIVRAVARRNGGDVTVESAPGEGSRFTVQFASEVPA